MKCKLSVGRGRQDSSQGSLGRQPCLRGGVAHRGLLGSSPHAVEAGGGSTVKAGGPLPAALACQLQVPALIAHSTYPGSFCKLRCLGSAWGVGPDMTPLSRLPGHSSVWPSLGGNGRPSFLMLEYSHKSPGGLQKSTAQASGPGSWQF